MLKIFSKKKKEIKEEKDYNIYNGSVHYGTFMVNDKKIEGAYIRDGQRTFCTSEGIGYVSPSAKFTQINTELKDIEVVQHNVECVQKGYCSVLIGEIK